ncbi:MAG: class I adenylate-forming enzyme family protein [Pseudomonadota bacterium]
MLSVTDPGPIPPPPDRFNLASYVLAQAGAQPDKIALSILDRSGAERWSYARLNQTVGGTATGLLQQGLEPGDRVLLRLGNSVEFPLAFLGAITAGLVPVPTSAQLTEPEVARLIDIITPRLVLRDADVSCPSTEVPVLDAAALHAMHDLPPAAPDMGDPERLAYIVFTSGTSGQPRAVTHAHRAIWARRMMFDGWYGLTASDRLMHAGAFNWTYTLGTGLMDPWTLGATALIPAPGTQAAQLPLLLKRHDATIFAAAPGVYRQMLDAGNLPALPGLRHGLVAGEKLPDPLRTRWQNVTGRDLYEAYGMSECSTFVSACPANPAAPGSLGRPQPGRRVAILGDDGPVRRGSEGTIAVHRSDPGLMLGYLDAPEATAARYAGDWFCTGDQGVMDEDGNISYLGRDDDMMNAGGFRVSPLEVEAVLNTHPGIGNTAVTEIEVRPDVRVIMAFYTATGELGAAELTAYAAERLARYKQPRGYIRVDTLPTGANGKLLRRALRPIYEARHGAA